MILKISGGGGGGGKKNFFVMFFYVLFKMNFNFMYFLFYIIYDKISIIFGFIFGGKFWICV